MDKESQIIEIGASIVLAERGVKKGLFRKEIEAGRLVRGTVTGIQARGSILLVKVDGIDTVSKWHNTFWEIDYEFERE